ncbi:MAG: right-handed parallel beta-helix repeat-containing protein [Fimbriimonadaceae bacterium]|nr:right-handed parallel beta-helix repeat-containing protein [Fimbriimonadaceae bacterium]
MLLCTLLLATLPELPELAWTPRSDWLNVRRVTPGAVGDGRADDTAALQAVLDKLVDGQVVYLPPGTYRLTATLHLDGPRHGTALIGHGRSTRLVWDGPANGTLFQSNGAAYARYVGLTWDGRGSAAVGFHHGSQQRFETEVRHEYEAFVDCREFGLKLGGGQQQASAEILYWNCLFARCGIGAGMLAFNYYDNTFDRCAFVDCGQAIHDTHGNFYARNCHFEASREVDCHVASEHGSSVRRCSSRGSRQFLRQVGSVVPVTIQDCQVAGWTDPAGAVVLSGPTATLIDVTFSSPPSAEPPIANRGDRPLTVSNVTAAGCRDTVRQRPAGLAELPPGRLPAVVRSPDERFFRSSASVPSKVFDARTDCGARGDGTSDDTAAVQAAIDAARQHGQGALAYLPQGRYVIRQTLRVSGSDYVVGGTGFRCTLLWRGPADQPILAVHDPQRVRLEHLSIGHHDFGPVTASADVVQTSSGRPSLMAYDGVYVFGMYQRQPDVRGLRLERLGPHCRVDLGHLQGNLTLTDCARATVLLRTSYEGTITVQGTARERDGFLGVLTRLSTLVTTPLRLRDSHSLVASDWYVEQAAAHAHLSGAPTDPPGRLTFSGAKAHVGQANPLFQLTDYHGAFVFAGNQFYCEPLEPELRQTGTAPVELLLWGNCFYNTRFKLSATAALRAYALANQPAGSGQAPALPPPPTALLQAACDDWRRLGQVERELDGAW